MAFWLTEGYWKIKGYSPRRHFGRAIQSLLKLCRALQITQGPHFPLVSKRVAMFTTSIRGWSGTMLPVLCWTLDQIQTTILEAERKRCVLTHFMTITQPLVERNLALRNSSNKLFQPDNGDFLKEVHLLAYFDPVLEYHRSKIKAGVSHTHYPEKCTQNKLLHIVSDKMLEVIVTQVRDSKYISIILDCIWYLILPDIIHQGKIFIIMRSVAFKGIARDQGALPQLCECWGYNWLESVHCHLK